MKRAVRRIVALAGGIGVAVQGSRDSGPDDVADDRSIFSALQSDLGLRLVAAKEPIEVLVIDRAAEPSEN